ncbi:hypothetical protein EPO15_04455 [bacterium]|nr:MAG: hypothetical protein EPO15_04455 [bacterium]
MKRHRVRLRPKARSARRESVGRAAVVIGAAGLAAVLATARPFERVRLPRVGWGPLARALTVEQVTVEGVPPELAAELALAASDGVGAAWGPFEPDRRAKALLARYPWLEQVSPGRSWTGKTVRFLAVPRGAAAVVPVKAGTSYLAEDGNLFAAPAAVVAAAGLPRVELGAFPAGGDLKDLAGLIRAAGAEGALPSKPLSYAYDARERGWTVALEDGTRLSWGAADWTDEKLGRLREVLADAAGRLPKGFTADLRYFEDGRILVRP